MRQDPNSALLAPSNIIIHITRTIRHNTNSTKQANLDLFLPRLDILPEAQKTLWKEINHTPAYFTLYGGTAIALQLGHRHSIDFDFFALQDIDADRLLSTVSYLSNARVTHREPNTLSCIVDRNGPVKLSFFGLPHLKRIAEPARASDTGLPCARLLDLAATKAQTVQARASAKDYVDIEAIITRAAIPLSHHLSAARYVFGRVFEPIATLKALSHFEDVPELPPEVKANLLAAVAATDPGRIPPLSAIGQGVVND